MRDKEVYVLVFLLTSYIILSAVSSYRLFKSRASNPANVTLKIILCWLVPFFWTLLITVFTSPAFKSKVNPKNRYRESGYKKYTRRF
jgi:hypothetical protein